MSSYEVRSFYRFFALAPDELSSLAESLEQKGLALELNGLIILASEGINGTVAGAPENIGRYTALLKERTPLTDEDFKTSIAAGKPFKRFKVRVKDEIVTSGPTGILSPTEQSKHYLTPEEWHQALSDEERDFVLIDVRNNYETSLGMFKGALDPSTKNFKDFPEFVKNSGLPKDKKVLMYCTGGIRCEKAAVEMRRQGYEAVYQLHGGILRYLEQFPNGFFEGECFVFDWRVALTPELQPSELYRLCPHCGDPGKERIECLNCGDAAVVCADCRETEERITCSKDCANQYVRKNDRCRLRSG